jgi:twitching motility protein PilT
MTSTRRDFLDGARSAAAGRGTAGAAARWLEGLLRAMDAEATDLHLKPMRPPMVRVRGELKETAGSPLTPTVLEQLVAEIAPQWHRERLAELQRAEFGYSVPGVSRYRASIYRQRGSLVVAFRRLAWELPDLEDLGLSGQLLELVGVKSGLILVCGPPASGRSTTVRALIREIVDRRMVHVMTLEQPIELPLRDGVGSVSQQEIGTDVPGLAAGLDAALSEDSDVLVIDAEPQPRELLRALDAAYRGRLVIVTLLADSADDAIEKVCELVPAQWRKTARMRLSELLQACVVQRLAEAGDGRRTPSAELCRPAAGVLRRLTEGAAASPRRHFEPRRTDETSAPCPAGESSSAAAILESAERAASRSEEDGWNRSRDGGEKETCPLEPVVRDVEIASEDRLHEALAQEDRYERLLQRYRGFADERDRRVQALETQLAEQQRRSAELRRQLEQLSEEKEQILRSVEREARRFSEEEKQQRARLRELEGQLRERGLCSEHRGRQIELLERERKRTVEMVEAHCREYERRIARLQQKLREHGIDPL